MEPFTPVDKAHFKSLCNQGNEHRAQEKKLHDFDDACLDKLGKALDTLNSVSETVKDLGGKVMVLREDRKEHDKTET